MQAVSTTCLVGFGLCIGIFDCLASSTRQGSFKISQYGVLMPCSCPTGLSCAWNMLFLGWRAEERNVLDNVYIVLRLHAQHMTCEREAE